ncbi:MAG: hypothetical protein LBN08_02740 [Lactobacillales bacterium]|jgi:hypothetical protein|nr:hypothetical protein [Lactobacillales bacterium]
MKSRIELAGIFKMFIVIIIAFTFFSILPLVFDIELSVFVLLALGLITAFYGVSWSGRKKKRAIIESRINDIPVEFKDCYGNVVSEFANLKDAAAFYETKISRNGVLVRNKKMSKLRLVYKVESVARIMDAKI